MSGNRWRRGRHRHTHHTHFFTPVSTTLRIYLRVAAPLHLQPRIEVGLHPLLHRPLGHAHCHRALFACCGFVSLISMLKHTSHSIRRRLPIFPSPSTPHHKRPPPNTAPTFAAMSAHTAASSAFNASGVSCALWTTPRRRASCGPKRRARNTSSLARARPVRRCGGVGVFCGVCGCRGGGWVAWGKTRGLYRSIH